MHPPPPHSLGVRLPLLAFGVLAAHSTLAAQAAPAPPVASTGFPDPLPLALLASAVCGAVGAFAADLVTDGGRIEQWRRDEAGWSLGFVAKMIIGLVAAIILLTLNPPGEAWVALVGTALVAGLGGEAILLAIIASRRAQAAEIARRQSQEDVIRNLADWEASIRGLQSVALAAAPAGHPAFSAAGNLSLDESAAQSPLRQVVQAYTDDAVAEIRRRAATTLP